ncbi:ABC-2 type transport system permease protein [Allocatelliglobosispora scoriae]|uniref:ABC-2 type transport system permease protein n=1 Tax=Allocatelliglobosispora scoriae TaxID=643052 RepID=A0A841C1U8_9ACTN|nr:ABC transporter permease [Allocatelliglobosispora scoriae]MBB5873032.1 ABC-2 type transport system permease protein [Allocatelliglobosispora scoriae]
MFTSVLAFESKRMLRNIPSIFFGVLLPTILLVIFAGPYGNEPAEVFAGAGSVDIAVPRYAGLVLACAGMVSFLIGLVDYRAKGFLPHLRLAPGQPKYFMRAQVLVNGVVGLAGLLLLIGWGAIAYDLHAPAHPVAFAGIVALAGAAMFAIGMFFAAVLRHDGLAILVANVLHLVMIFWSGAAIPTEFMPDSAHKLGELLPLTYAVRAMEWAWLDRGGDALGADLGVLVGTVVVCGAVSIWRYRWK